MNLSDWAERVGVSKFTAYRWFREGTLPLSAEKLGRLVLVDMERSENPVRRTVLYVRVSCHDQGVISTARWPVFKWATRCACRSTKYSPRSARP